jgi:hypothetical protein
MGTRGELLIHGLERSGEHPHQCFAVLRFRLVKLLVFRSSAKLI